MCIDTGIIINIYKHVFSGIDISTTKHIVEMEVMFTNLAKGLGHHLVGISGIFWRFLGYSFSFIFTM